MTRADMPNRPKVLVVDDEPAIVDTLTMILEAHGFDAVGAYSGGQAILAAHASHPDCLLTDVMMPDKNGVEVAFEIQTAIPECIIILFSGDPDTARALVFAHPECPKWDVLSKPISPGELLEKLERLMNSSWLSPNVNGQKGPALED